ncbi:hypothetical protein [Haloferula sp.]|uniref:hypothetical protein n=1 Tax=Haloferula sp. TaxID=2497595 RepID=UPI003C70A445
MSHFFRHIPHPYRPWLRLRRRSNRKPFLISLAGLALVLSCASCTSTYTEPAPIPVTDTEPIGKGLSIIGYSILGGMVVLVLGSIIKR